LSNTPVKQLSWYPWSSPA